MFPAFRRLWNDLLSLITITRTPLPPPVSPLPPSPARPQPIPLAPEAEVVAAINKARASAGLDCLVEDASLGQLANDWASSMATSHVMQHGDFGGRVGSIYPNTAAAENIAEGQSVADEAIAAWMDSPPHRANIFGDFNRVGVGSARDQAGSTYWCADFVRVD